MLIYVMKIIEITDNKELYMDLMLLGDEQENMILKYLYRGDLFALYDDDLRSFVVVTKEDNNTCELKNIATYEKYRRKGYASYLINYIIQYYKDHYKYMLVGTGDNEKIISFYKKFGFKYSHTVKDFFINNYEHEIIEDGKRLKDMIYLKYNLTDKANCI